MLLSDSSCPASAVEHGARVRLPKITLPHFDCNLTKWTSFCHTNNDLTDVDKFNYLRSPLEHTALMLLQGLFSLLQTSGNLEEAFRQ